MKESLQNIGDLVAEPKSTFTRLKSQPRWGVAFVIFYLFSVLLLWAIAPYTQQLMSEGMAEADAPSEQLQTIAQDYGNAYHLSWSPFCGGRVYHYQCAPQIRRAISAKK